MRAARLQRHRYVPFSLFFFFFFCLLQLLCDDEGGEAAAARLGFDDEDVVAGAISLEEWRRQRS